MNDLLHLGWSLPPALWEAAGLTLRLAAIVTVLLLVVAVPLAWWLARSRRRWVIVVETLVSLPIVLPPTVLGFYLLVLFAPDLPLGRLWFTITGGTLVFSFWGLVFGSILYCLPYAVQPVTAAFRAVPRPLLDAAINLGATPGRAWRRVALPLARRGIAAGALLAFAHTIGEFGLVVMLGGSIPGKTKVASIALYDEVQALNYPVAHAYAGLLLVVSFALLLAINFVQRRGGSPLAGD